MELIKIYQGNLIDARELYHFLEIKTAFNSWIARNLIKSFREDTDFQPFLAKSNGGRQSKEYLLTIDTAKKLSMMAKTPRGAEARNYFLECEKALIQLKQNKRLEAFQKLEATKGKLEQNVIDLGGTQADYIQIDTAGSRIFFNSQEIQDEVLPTILLMGRGFATEMTNEVLKDGGIALGDVEELNKIHHQDIRKVLASNVKKMPEDLPRESNIKKALE